MTIQPTETSVRTATETMAAAPLPDENVVARVLAGEPRLFELLMRRYNQRLFRITRAILKDDAGAEDAMQDAYVQAFTKLAQFEGRSSFATWVTRIAIHAALGRVRRDKRENIDHDLEDADLDRMAPEQHPMSSQSLAKNPENDAVDRELKSTLEREIDALPEHYRTVFVLRAVEELTVPETAECLGLQEETVRTRFFRARNMLQKALLDRADGVARGAFDFHLSRCDRIVAGVFARLGLEPERAS
jgi:RNA polymerase sigma-70 factor (ECF subfamily)